MTVPFWTRGDLNAFFGLGINMLVNVLVLAGLCIGVVHMAPDDVYQVVTAADGTRRIAVSTPLDAYDSDQSGA